MMPIATPSRPAARAIVINDAQEILLVHPRDLPIWAIPGGKVEAGEAPAAAAVRETWEETGYQITLEACLGVYWLPQLPERSSTYLYRGRVVGGAALRHGPETRAVRWFPRTRLPWRLPGVYRRLIELARTQAPNSAQHPIYLACPEVLLMRTLRRVRRWAQR